MTATATYSGYIRKFYKKMFISIIKTKINHNLYNIAIILIIFYSSNNINAQNNDYNEYLKREHSLVKPYQGSGMTIPFWDFSGSTIVTKNYIRLTSDDQSLSGSLWNQIPVMSRNWEVHVSFKVHGKGKDLFGDGFAIWYAKKRMDIGAVFGSVDYFSGMAIILDTYSNHNGPHNHQHPYISAMVNNGTLSYDHDRDGTHTQLAGCEAKFRNVDYDTIVSIRYENDILIVSTDIENKGRWKQCFMVEGVLLPTGYYFGASATTGDLSDNHDIMYIKYYDLDVNYDAKVSFERQSIIPHAATFDQPREHADDPKPGMSNIKIFFLILLGMLFAVAIAVIGIMFYQKHKENSRKRFY